MRLIYVTRKYPPAIGGSENFSYYLSKALSELLPTELIAWPGPRLQLPVFCAAVLIRARRVVRIWRSNRCSQSIVIHFGDAALAPLAIATAEICRVPVSLTAHGYEVTHSNRAYQSIVGPALRRMPLIACVSESTAGLCEERGIRRDNLWVIRHGVSGDEFYPENSELAQQQLVHRLPNNLVGRKIILALGRLVPRKGILWFVESVMPYLAQQRPDVMLWVIGSGPQRERIELAVQRLGLEQFVMLWGSVDVATIRYAAALSKVFVAPNIKVESNPEGFGLVTLEARAMGLPVVVSDVDGLAESVSDGQDGFIIKEKDGLAFSRAICRILDSDGPSLTSDEIRQRVCTDYNWRRVAHDYIGFFEEVARITVGTSKGV